MMKGLFGVDLEVLSLSCVLVVAVGLPAAGCATKPQVPDGVIPEGRTCEELGIEDTEESADSANDTPLKISKEALTSALKKHGEELKECYYDKVPQSNSGRVGKVTFYLRLKDTGEFGIVHPCKTNIPHRDVHNCLRKAILDVQVPIEKSGDPVGIFYPFVFR